MALRQAMGDERGFVHKRIFGGIKGAIGGLVGGGPGGIIGGAFKGFLGRPTVSRALPFGVAASPATQAARRAAGGNGCPPGAVRNEAGQCVQPSPTFQRFGGAPIPVTTGCPPGFVSILGRCVPTSPISGISDPLAIGRPVGVDGLAGVAGDPFGAAVMGRFGAAIEPEQVMIDHRRCPRGAVLGQDGLCYNKRDLRNSERFWPRGRRPLLTGGEMRCISVASAAAKKLQRKQKQLEELGLLKKAAPRARRALPRGHVAQIAHG